MHGIRKGMIAGWVMAAMMLSSLIAQSLPEWLAADSIPKPPDFGVRDNTGFFNRNSGAMKRISDLLRTLEADHGYRIYLIVEPVLIATSAPEMAAHLQQSWLPNGDGLVVVYESDSRGIGFGREIGGTPDLDSPVGRVPTHDTAAILLKASAATDSNLPPPAYLETLMGNLVREFDSYFKKRADPPPAGRSLRYGLLTVGGLTLLTLFAVLIGTMVRLPSMAESRKFRFSEVNRPERLGAPCGGGDVTTRRFRLKIDR